MFDTTIIPQTYMNKINLKNAILDKLPKTPKSELYANTFLELIYDENK